MELRDDSQYPVLTKLINDTQDLYDKALNLSVENATAEMVLARKGEIDLPTKIGKIDTQLSDMYKDALVNGVIANDQSKATSNATILNQLLMQGNVRISGEIYVDDTIIVPSSTALIGVKGKTKIRMTSLNKNIIKISANSLIRDFDLYFPNGITTLVAGIYESCADNVTFYTAENITINGLAPWNVDERTIGIHQDATSSGTIYYGHHKNVVVTNCYYGVKQTKVSASGYINANRFTDLVLQNNIWQMDIVGGGNVFLYTAQTFNKTIHNVTCSGSNNIFNGVIYDIQTGVTGLLAYEFNGLSAGNVFNDWVGGYLTDYVFDAGSNNRISNPSFDIKQFISSGETRGTDTNGSSKVYPAFNGLQDNALAYMHKRGTVTLNTGTITYGSVNKIFDHNQPYDGTAFSDPSVTPIEITIDFPSALYSVFMGIVFDGVKFAQNFEIWTKTSSGGAYSLFKSVTNNNRSNWLLSPSIGGYNNYWGIKIKITKAFSTATVNTSKYVQIKAIWVTDSMNGGQTFLKQGGGTLYGDLDLSKNKIKNMVLEQAATTSRPTSPTKGQMFYDTTLNKPIWYNGAAWTDATGTTV